MPVPLEPSLCFHYIGLGFRAGVLAAGSPCLYCLSVYELYISTNLKMADIPLGMIGVGRGPKARGQGRGSMALAFGAGSTWLGSTEWPTGHLRWP